MEKLGKLSKYLFIVLTTLLGLFIFVFPTIAAIEFSFRGAFGKGHDFTNYIWIIHQEGFLSHLLISLVLATLASIFNIFLMVPTAVYVELKTIKVKPLIDFLCLLPLVIPVVSLAIGAQSSMPSFIQNSQYELVFFFVVISLPYTYRAIDNSLSGVPLKTLVEASRGLGANRIKTIISVIVPAIKSGISGAFFLCFALSFGEFTITSLLHWETFPTWTLVISQQNILGAIALSIFSFFFAVALLIAFSSFSRFNRNSSEIREVL